MLMFDLPMATSEERRIYSAFRKRLIKSAYTAMQESVYVKLLRNVSSAGAELEKLREYAPETGRILALPVSLQGFRRLLAVRGENFDISGFSDSILYF
jgi:CRISPR-associated protein Cas2